MLQMGTYWQKILNLWHKLGRVAKKKYFPILIGIFCFKWVLFGKVGTRGVQFATAAVNAKLVVKKVIFG